MAGETEWFLRMFHNNAISQDMRRAWALDSLAMGPHGAWIEPEVLEESLAGGSARRMARPTLRLPYGRWCGRPMLRTRCTRLR